MGLNLGDLAKSLRAVEESIATRAPRRIAERVAVEVQDAGPAWTGTFRNAWRIAAGDVTVPATIQKDYDYEPGDRANPVPVQRPTVPALGPGLRTRAALSSNKVLYTIGNAAKHREVAMDLVPGRLKDGKGGTAPQDWFTTYLQGGAFDQTVQVELDRAISEAAKQ
jgi:hypothetical protein